MRDGNMLGRIPEMRFSAGLINNRHCLHGKHFFDQAPHREPFKSAFFIFEIRKPPELLRIHIEACCKVMLILPDLPNGQAVFTVSYAMDERQENPGFKNESALSGS